MRTHHTKDFGGIPSHHPQRGWQHTQVPASLAQRLTAPGGSSAAVFPQRWGSSGHGLLAQQSRSHTQPHAVLSLMARSGLHWGERPQRSWNYLTPVPVPAPAMQIPKTAHAWENFCWTYLPSSSKSLPQREKWSSSMPRPCDKFFQSIV